MDGCPSLLDIRIIFWPSYMVPLRFQIWDMKPNFPIAGVREESTPQVSFLCLSHLLEKRELYRKI
jgi:hypothetical protein